jgi:flagellar biosynthesis/type III secretory pathway protein FliH
MLRETAKRWTREWLAEGRKEGLAEGRKQGLKESREAGCREGVARLLIHQLEFKFGSLSPRDQERIDALDADRLLELGDRLLTAKSLAEVFGP